MKRQPWLGLRGRPKTSQHLRKVKDQLSIAKEQIGALKKKLNKAEKVAAHAEQEGHDIKIMETEENLRA